MNRRWALLVTLSVAAAGLATASPARAVVAGPDGRIAYCRYIVEIDSCDLYTAEPDGTDEQLLIAGPAESPHWSPDGSRLSIATFSGDLVVTGIIKPDGSGLVQLNTGLPINTPASAWSPNGSRLADEVWSDANPSFVPGVFTMRSSDGGDLRRLTANPYGGHDIPADYAPDGSRLLFLRENPQLSHGGRLALFEIGLDGMGITQLTRWSLNAGSGRWSPDGSRIVFAVGAGRSKGSIWTIRPDGTGLRKLFQDPRGGFAFQPTWAPSGDHILFALIPAFTTGGEDLYSIGPDGSGLTQVTTTPDDFEDSPDWGTYSG